MMSAKTFLRYILAFFILNFLLSGCYFVYVDRPVIYYEYIFLPLLFVFIANRTFQYVSVSMLIFMDVLLSLSHFYFFDSFNYLVKFPSLFISSFDLIQLIYGVLGITFLIGAVYLIRKAFITEKKNKESNSFKKTVLLYSILGFISIYSIDMYNGSSFINFRPAANNHVNIGKSLFRELYKDARIYYKNYAPIEHITDFSTRSKKLPPAYTLLNDRTSSQQLLIILESWGLPENQILKSALYSAIESSLPVHYDVAFDSTLSLGGTSQAEARELLNKSGEAYYSVVQHEKQIHQGLVNAKRNQGFQVLSRQGFSGFHSNGYKFRKLIGFSDVKEYSYYRDSLHYPDVFFNHYKSVDDRLIIDQITKELIKFPKSFGYLLTINTHLPFELPGSEKKNLSYVEATKQLKKYFPTDESFDQFYLILEQLKHAAKQVTLNNIHKVVIVGDHPPPFLKSNERNLYSSKFVPSVTLELSH